MSDQKQNWDKWEQLETLKLSMLKKIYTDHRVIGTFIIELWANAKNVPYVDGVKRYQELYKHMTTELNEYLFAEYGTLDMKDILPNNPGKE